LLRPANLTNGSIAPSFCPCSKNGDQRAGNVIAKDYVEQRDEGYWITSTRVSLDSVVYAFLEGLSPESIVDSFDTLTLEEVYGAIAFYLGHRDTVDAYLKQSEAQFDDLCRRARAANPLLYQKLDEARRHMTVRP
jgi:uncharacterized protein (DUF433 family)